MNDFPKSAGVVIIGGGVIGLAIARQLARRGMREVVLIERSRLGTESSYAAAGMLAPQAEADEADEFFYLTCRSRDLYPDFASTLLEETGVNIELDTSGTLYLALTENDVNEIEKRYEWQSRAGLPVRRLSAEEARYFEPSITPDVRGALKFPADMQVENRRLISALAVACERLGVRIVTDTNVEVLQLQRGNLAGVKTSRGILSTRRVVIAGGAWSSQLALANENEPTGKALPDVGIEPVRGQMLSFEINPQVFSHVIYSRRGYVVPRRDGRLLAGSTTELEGFDKRVTASGMQSITSAALEISPLIASLPLTASWAGLRPRASDGLPVLGPCAEIAGVFYATGHYRNGILLAPLTAELIAEAIIDEVIPISIEAFSPDRFSRIHV